MAVFADQLLKFRRAQAFLYDVPIVQPEPALFQELAGFATGRAGGFLYPRDRLPGSFRAEYAFCMRTSP